jgi:hypothetical protein
VLTGNRDPLDLQEQMEHAKVFVLTDRRVLLDLLVLRENQEFVQTNNALIPVFVNFLM